MFKISLNNLRNGDDNYLYLMLTATGDYSGDLTLNQSMTLAAFKQQFPDLSFSIDYIDAGRLYVGYGELPQSPVPDGSQYYGWVELTRKETDQCVWINLTNVDVVALPLALAGVTPENSNWSLGYENSITDIIGNLESVLVSNDAKIVCSTGKPGYAPTKIVGPNIVPQSYRSYDDYIAALRAASAELVITTDTPAGANAKVFSGSFIPAASPASSTDPVISLTSAQGDTFVVEIGQFTSEIIYRCDGGTLIYNGQTVPQNQTKTPLTADEVYANSTFRNIMIGINEGYFTPVGDNYSANFPYYTPFKSSTGSQYAEVIHNGSNSYGFPYADSNLKVLISASLTGTINLTIMTDDAAYGYDSTPPNNGNQPLSGDYQFGIGANSQALGTIEIGNCRYLPNADGAYGGFLPTLSEWTKMYFSGPDKYIWFKTTGAGSLVGSDCFDCNGQPYAGTIDFGTNKDAIWPANVSWNPAKQSPPRPTS